MFFAHASNPNAVNTPVNTDSENFSAFRIDTCGGRGKDDGMAHLKTWYGRAIVTDGHRPGLWRDIAEPNRMGWRALHVADDLTQSVFPIRFDHEQGAELAMRAIENVIDWSGPNHEVIRRLDKLGYERLRELMTENLGW